MISHLIFFISCVLLINAQSFPTKKLAGPPSEFASMRTPNPASILTELPSSSIYVWFTPSASSEVVYTYPILVDAVEQFVFSIASPFYKHLKIDLVDPVGKPIDLASLSKDGFMPLGEDIEVPVVTYIVPETQQGVYELVISSDMPKSVLQELSTSGYPNAIITVLNNDNVVISTHMTTYEIKQGKNIGIISTITTSETATTEVDFHIDTAELEIITPEGIDEEIPMSDSYEGLSQFNYEPGTGIYGAHFEASDAGTYIVQAILKGTWNTPQSLASIPFERTSQHIIQVSSATIELTGSASVRTKDSEHVLIDIDVTGTGDQLRAYAEVYGVDPLTLEVKPACWLGGIVTVENNAVTLELDTNWLKLAGVSGPIRLQNVYIADLVTSFPISSASVEMSVMGSENLEIELTSAPITITKQMRVGVNPIKYQANNNTAAGPSLVLFPGYCASNNPWLSTQSVFTNAGFFTLSRGNYRHHEFALKAMTYLESLNSPSFSLIGHSQGGCVATHIYNYFFSGLDSASGGRLIQSVGSPYTGCTAAGSLANLGEIFGVGCGSNNDLSLDGAANWLTGISPDTSKEVHYYTTTYEQGRLFGDYCNLAINLVLQWPNDGTAELKFATIPHGVNMGNTQKQCHTTSMSYPAQYTDATRNAQMNAAAAR